MNCLRHDWVAAPGPLRLLATVGSAMPASARASRRAGRGHIADCWPSLREGALRCSASWPVAELTSLAALATFKQAATSMLTKRADARGQEACASRLRTRRCARTPPVTLRATVLVFDVRSTNPACRPEGGAASGRLCAAEERRSCGRVRSAPRDLTRRRCLSAVSAANAASSATGPQGRAPQGTRSEAKGQQSEPRRRTALGLAPQPRKRTLNLRKGPRTDSGRVRPVHALQVVRSALELP